MKVLQFDFGQLTIDDHIIIGEVTQDRNVEMDVVSVVIETANKYFHGEPWAYISNRTNSYSLNPNVHQNASSFSFVHSTASFNDPQTWKQ